MKQRISLLFFMFIAMSSIVQASQAITIEHTEKQPINRFNIIFNELNLFDISNEASKWDFMEKKFITDIYTPKKMTWSQISAAIPAACAALAGYDYATNSLLEHATKHNLMVVGGGSLALGLVSAQYLDYYLTKQAHRAAITNFFTNWEIYKFYVPDELINYCQAIADAFDNNEQELVLQNAQKIVKELQDITTRHFEARYKKQLELEAAYNLADTKTASEILKNLVGTAKDIA